jgi:hypothetical protein
MELHNVLLDLTRQYNADIEAYEPLEAVYFRWVSLNATEHTLASLRVDLHILEHKLAGYDNQFSRILDPLNSTELFQQYLLHKHSNEYALRRSDRLTDAIGVAIYRRLEAAKIDIFESEREMASGYVPDLELLRSIDVLFQKIEEYYPTLRVGDYRSRVTDLINAVINTRHMALMQTDHNRLGSSSLLRALDPHLLKSISGLSLR